MSIWNDHDWIDLFMEFEAPGSEDEPEEYEMEDDEYSMDGEDTGEETEDNEPAPQSEEPTNEPAPTSEEPTEEVPAETNPQEETPTQEEPTDGEDGGEEPEEYELPDDEGEEPTEGGDSEEATEPGAEGEETGDDEYSMDDAEGGEEGQESPEGGDNTPPPEEPAPDESHIDTKLKDLETVLFDDLSEVDKRMKLKELKELYIAVYDKCGSILELISNIRKDEETTQIVEYISNTLIDLKHYVNDYINDVFESKTYMENLSQLQKYIMIFNAINKVFDQIKHENHE